MEFLIPMNNKKVLKKELKIKIIIYLIGRK